LPAISEIEEIIEQQSLFSRAAKRMKEDPN
jgi:hypothetical protein